MSYRACGVRPVLPYYAHTRSDVFDHGTGETHKIERDDERLCVTSSNRGRRMLLSDHRACAGQCNPPSRNGTPACYEYSWRRATAARGVRECARCGCWALRCSAHDVRRPAWGPRKRTRHHRADRPHAVPRRPAGSERKLTVTAEAYMLFRAGIKPMTEFVNAAGVRATQNRRRAELAVRPKDFEM